METKEEIEALDRKLEELSEEKLQEVAGGFLDMKNPVSGMSREEAERISAELEKGQDMGSWSTMSGGQFMKWWEDSNGKTSQEIPGA